MEDSKDIQPQVMKEIPAFTVLKNGSILKNIFLLRQKSAAAKSSPSANELMFLFDEIFDFAGIDQRLSRKRRKSSGSPPRVDAVYLQPDVVEELIEEGSALLSKRLHTKYPLCNLFKLFTCAVCQKEMKPGEGISILAASGNLVKPRPWDGPFLCLSCHEKREAMEGKRP
ncbi:hypothetical protein SSX86_007665 [Deinandra increscens subsp. villosa]|uniref:Uncharacterized protein n=1 Tax=Deinandra increscens subsp. villosa TaxID=3103831 RepID=A0AAP0DF37_9ASTR